MSQLPPPTRFCGSGSGRTGAVYGHKYQQADQDKETGGKLDGTGTTSRRFPTEPDRAETCNSRTMKRASEELPDHQKKKKKKKREEMLTAHQDEGQKKKKKKRRSTSQQEEPEDKIKDEEEENVHLPPLGGLMEHQEETKKKKSTDEEEEEGVPPTAGTMQHQDRKKKKNRRTDEESPAVDLESPKKRKKKKKVKSEEEEIIPSPPDGLTHDHKKKKKREGMTSQQEDDPVCIAVTTVSPETNSRKEKQDHSSTQEDTKRKQVKQQKKKNKAKLEDLNRSIEEEEINWSLVEELQDYLPHAKNKCVNQVKKLLACDLHRFRKFRQQGVPARFGRFSEQENQQIRANVADFLVLSGVGSVEKLLFPQRFKEEQATIRKLKKEHRFIERIAEGIPRPCNQVYLRALKIFDENNHMGRFSEDELAALIRFHKIHGNNWKVISEKMDRSVFSLQKRFATVGVDHGVWSQEEDNLLKQAVKEHLQNLTEQNPSSGLSRAELSKRLPWKDIAQKVKTRSWTQCRIRWLHFLDRRITLYGKVFNRGAKGYQAKLRLLNTLYNLSVEDIADINWDEVAKAVGEVTPWSVQRMFNRLKQRKVPNFHNLSFGEIIDFLYQHEVPVLENKLKSCSGWAELQNQHREDRYQLLDIFCSDIEDDDS